MSIASPESTVVESAPNQLLIGGEWRDAGGGERLAVEDPSTGETSDRGRRRDSRGRHRRPSTRPSTRRPNGPRRRRTSARRSSIARSRRSTSAPTSWRPLMTLEMGKSVAESKAEIAYSAEFFRWFSGEALRIDGYCKVAGNGAVAGLVMRQPVGPCYFITPWNFPTAMGTRKIGPAIAAGCTMVVKPAQQTPLSMLALAELLADCGLPGRGPQRHHQLVVERGVEADHRRPAPAQAVVHRIDRGRPEADRPGGRQRPQGLDGARRQRAVSDLRRRRPRRRARGRDDREDAQHRRGLHLGESLPRRRLGRRRVRRSKLAERMGALKLGRGTDEDVDVGPLIDDDQRSKVAELVDDAVGKGAKALVGGPARDGAGYFFEPTVARPTSPTTHGC